MIDGLRRGHMAASERVQQQPACLTEEQLLEEARYVLASMRVRGYAHLDPEHEFLRGYIAGFQSASLLFGKDK